MKTENPTDDVDPSAIGLEELRQLHSEIAITIGNIDRGILTEMTETEQFEHVRRFGCGAVVIGNFVIRRR